MNLQDIIIKSYLESNPHSLLYGKEREDAIKKHKTDGLNKFNNNNMKSFFKIFAKSGEDKREFNIYTSKSRVNDQAEKMAKNIFYCDNITIINITKD